ncbi:hypothetical protein WR25_19957 [Diploscapter pachys]|uniref:WW domain-containing protein n=1 Tax=Diploscapter pachys TaxID=2018661 RepID=A0A2A2KAR2_9BILA|nr:hypothetical protein WR25_19957 [Diploscapter pachys]
MSASRKIEKAKTQTNTAQQTTQILHHQPEEKSLKELFNKPVGIYERRPRGNAHTLPQSFYTPSSRGRSSVGHSPQGSSEEVLVSSSSSNLVPPVSMHRREKSAPELGRDNRAMDFSASIRPQTSNPPVQHEHSKSFSALPPLPDSSLPPAPYHAKSYSLGANFAASYGGHTSTQHDSSPSLFHPTTREKSASFDPLLSNDMMPSHWTDLSLPSNWEEKYDDEGNRYFADHESKTTTWDDPRKAQFLAMRAAAQQQQQGMAYGMQQAPHSAGPFQTEPSYHDQMPYLDQLSLHHSSQNIQHPQQHAQQQHYGSHPYMHQGTEYYPANYDTMDRVQQLENEQRMMREKQMQISQSGLLERSPQSYQQAMSPMQQQQPQSQPSPMHMSAPFPYPQQQQMQGQMPVSQMLPSYAAGQQRSMSHDMRRPDQAASVPQEYAMEVDDFPVHSNQPILAGLNGINPREFDQYLASDHREPTSVGRYQ